MSKPFERKGYLKYPLRGSPERYFLLQHKKTLKIIKILEYLQTTSGSVKELIKELKKYAVTSADIYFLWGNHDIEITTHANLKLSKNKYMHPQVYTITLSPQGIRTLEAFHENFTEDVEHKRIIPKSPRI